MHNNGDVSRAAKLIGEIEVFRRHNPAQTDFTRELVRVIERIDREFQGETRDELLREAKETIDRQVGILVGTRRTMNALARLEKKQKRLVEELDRLTSFLLPETLH